MAKKIKIDIMEGELFYGAVRIEVSDEMVLEKDKEGNPTVLNAELLLKTLKEKIPTTQKRKYLCFYNNVELNSVKEIYL